ncbi:MAG: LysR family transcriptional regulator [Bacteroidetes bacterium]|nr:LysR family transcriptional regulator [Bacteroidota bacterium]
MAKIKNYTKTAQLLFVTQSAISHAIKKLETSIETPLIQKKGKTISLTDAGHSLFQSCEKIFYEIEKADQNIAYFKNEAKINIRIGSPVEFGTSILVNHIKNFLDTHHEIHLDFLFSHNLEKPLLQDEVDLIIDCKDHAFPHFEKIHLFQEQYITIASPEFVKKHNIISLKDLQNVNILSVDKRLEWWQNFIKVIPQEKKLYLKKIVQINHVRGLINGAIAGLGIGFVPMYTVLSELKYEILIDPFPEIKPRADYFNIFVNKEKLKFEKIQKLIGFLTELKLSEFGVDGSS